MSTALPTIVIIIGVTGDLSTRKLLPAIERVAATGAWSDSLKVLGITRQQVDVQAVLDKLPSRGEGRVLDRTLRLHQMDVTDIEAYRQLAKRLTSIEQEMGGIAQRLFYLSVPPQVSQPIVALLGESGLAGGAHTKLLLEKPFGVDVASAQEFIERAAQYFTESQIYRIDHYLAKEMAQNLIAFRQKNEIFREKWGVRHISAIDIAAYEQIGIEGRAAFYEQTGALRDVVQSHLLQLAALTLMRAPAPGQLDKIPALRLEALRHLRVSSHVPMDEAVIRGQYRGYREEVKNPRSMVETYVSLQLVSDDPKWRDVSVRLSTGKALKAKHTEIRVTYKKYPAGVPGSLPSMPNSHEATATPDGWTKAGGYEWRMEGSALQLVFRDYAGQSLDPYGQVLLEVIRGKHALFTSSQEVLETWRILWPVQEFWQFSDDMRLYEPGDTPPL